MSGRDRRFRRSMAYPLSHAMTAAICEQFAKNSGEFDSRKYLGPARDALKELYKQKNINVLGSAEKA
jgi:fructose-bisphosphate aldolase class II